MTDTILKTKILEKYQSIRYFCFIAGISSNSFYPYCNGTKCINSIRLKTLSKVCDTLECDPSDIEYTKEYWYTLCQNGTLRISDPPHICQKSKHKTL